MTVVSFLESFVCDGSCILVSLRTLCLSAERVLGAVVSWACMLQNCTRGHAPGCYVWPGGRDECRCLQNHRSDKNVKGGHRASPKVCTNHFQHRRPIFYCREARALQCFLATSNRCAVVELLSLTRNKCAFVEGPWWRRLLVRHQNLVPSVCSDRHTHAHLALGLAQGHRFRRDISQRQYPDPTTIARQHRRHVFRRRKGTQIIRQVCCPPPSPESQNINIERRSLGTCWKRHMRHCTGY